MTAGADALAVAVADHDPGSNVDLFLGTVVSVGATVRVDANGMQLACDTLVGVLPGDVVWVAQNRTSNVVLGAVDRNGWIGAETTVTTNGSGDWTVTLGSGARVVAAVANGAQTAFPHLHVRNVGTYPTLGAVAGWRCFNNGGGAVTSSTIGVSYLIRYDIG